MKTIVYSLLSICLLFSNSIFAQFSESYWAINAGVNFLSFKGDLNTSTRANSLNNFKYGFDIGAEKRLNNILGIQANFMHGKISQQDFYDNSGLNFESKINDISLQALLYFDNDILFNKKVTLAPYFGAGIGVLLFDPYGDLKDANGNTYYYWENGDIMDMEESPENIGVAQELQRDLVYESQLTADKAYSKNTISIPLTLGITAKLDDNWGARINYSYRLTTTDYIDNVSSDNKNDKLSAWRLGIIYAFNRSLKEHQHDLHDVELDLFHKHDSDGDGVADFHDHCQHTQIGVHVDKKGCPLDSDNDGVYDHLDKEANTPLGNHVDVHGVSITDEMFKMQQMRRDSVMHNRIESFNKAPSKETLEAIDKDVAKKRHGHGHAKFLLPEKFRAADENGDDIIQSSEINDAIDRFLEGELDISLSTLYELIDYFFEQ